MKSKTIFTRAIALAMTASLTASMFSISAFAEENGQKSDGTYILMNIPYDDFYKADIVNDIRVDSVTSATKQKTRTGTLVAGSFHVDSEGTDITGVTYPVKVSDVSQLTKYKEITDDNSITITTTNRGQTAETVYTGKESLFENEKYSYYVLSESEIPKNYKELSFDLDGNPVFSKIKGKETVTVFDADAEITADSKYGDYQVSIDGLPFDSSTIYGVIIKTEDGKSYGLRHLENIWRVSELSWCTGTTTAVHNCPTDSEHYKDMIGHTITNIEYITDSGVYNIPTSLEVAEYQYVYAGLTWSEYWENENVFLSGTDMTASSDELDAKGETDKGAFDVVSRATTNHGLHRGSYQCMATIYDTEGNAYKLSHWSQDGSTLYLTDGTSLGYKKGTLSLTDGTTKTMDYYEVTGIKYVPVKVKSSEYKEFCKLYPVTKNNASLVGGYGENKLSAYSEVAEVSENTNGLKTTEKQADGTFKFSERSLGSDSGLKDVEQKKATDITVTVRAADDAEAYGAFLRVDLNGEGYGALGANLQTVRWDYYGNDSSYKNKLVSYGTKFAADNWMHKSMGIQLGLTDSLRCQLPEGTDGTGYWRLTVYALGYKDFTFDIQANEENIVKVSYDEVDITALADVIQKAEALKQSDYTAQSWDSMITELQEAKDEIAAPHSQAAVNEAVEHLNAAILALEKALKPISEASIKLNTSTYTYDGSEKKPSVTIKDGTTTLIADSDYTVSYSNNINIGTATVTVTGKGSYMGSVKMNFNIIPATASNFKASSTSASAVKLTWNKVSGADGYIIYKYDNAKKTWVRVAKTTTNSNTYTVSKLSAGTTYKFAVKAYKTVSGKEITSSSYPQLTTTTNPANITKTNFTTSANTVKMSWNKVSGATGYRVYQYNTSTKKWKSVANTKNTSYTFSKLSSGTTYKFTVRAYKTLNGTTYLSPKYSTFTTSTNPTTVSFKLTAGSKKATVKWNKVSGATGYKVYYKTSKNGKWVALKTTTGTSYTKTGLTKGKTYYFTVKAYRTVGGKTYNASYATKSVKVK